MGKLLVRNIITLIILINGINLAQMVKDAHSTDTRYQGLDQEVSLHSKFHDVSEFEQGEGKGERIEKLQPDVMDLDLDGNKNQKPSYEIGHTPQEDKLSEKDEVFIFKVAIVLITLCTLIMLAALGLAKLNRIENRNRQIREQQQLEMN